MIESSGSEPLYIQRPGGGKAHLVDVPGKTLCGAYTGDAWRYTRLTDPVDLCGACAKVMRYRSRTREEEAMRIAVLSAGRSALAQRLNLIASRVSEAYAILERISREAQVASDVLYHARNELLLLAKEVSETPE